MSAGTDHLFTPVPLLAPGTLVSNPGKPNGIYKVHTEHVLGARFLLGGAVPLPEHQQRQLEQMEQALCWDDPKSGRLMRGIDPRVHHARKLVQALLWVVISAGLLAAGTVTHHAYLAAAGGGGSRRDGVAVRSPAGRSSSVRKRRRDSRPAGAPCQGHRLDPHAGDPAGGSRPAGGSAVGACSRRRWVVTAQAVGVVAVMAGAAWAISAEWAAIRGGFGVLGHVRLWWVGAASVAQAVSMTAFVLLQRRLLRAADGRLPLSWLLSTAHLANAIDFAVPLAGSGMAAGFAYRRFRRAGADPAVAALVLTLAGIFSTVAFAAVMVLAAVASGNPAAAGGSLAGAVVAAGAVGFIVVALRSAQGRARLERAAVWLVRQVQRIVHRPRADPGVAVRGAVGRVRGVHLGVAAAGSGLMWALLNWIADASCLVLAIKAVGAAVPWHGVLLVWTAGIGAGSFSPTPGGIGVVEATMIAALVAAGVRPAQAVAAVLIYRLVNAKLTVTAALMVRRFIGRLRRRRQPDV